MDFSGRLEKDIYLMAVVRFGKIGIQHLNPYIHDPLSLRLSHKLNRLAFGTKTVPIGVVKNRFVVKYSGNIKDDLAYLKNSMALIAVGEHVQTTLMRTTGTNVNDYDVILASADRWE